MGNKFSDLKLTKKFDLSDSFCLGSISMDLVILSLEN